MPRLWSNTIDEHREAVRRALVDAAGELVESHGLTGVTMSRLAQRSGIGRATIYRYFPDAGAVLEAWHARLVGEHLARLLAARDDATGPEQRLDAVLTAYAHLRRSQPGGELAAALHHGDHVARARRHLAGVFDEVLAEAATAGLVRDDVPASELVPFCVHALGAAAELTDVAEVDRLVALARRALAPFPAV